MTLTSCLRAGVGELDITPGVGARLAAELSSCVSKGVETPLMAKALVLSDGLLTLAIVTLDVFGLAPTAADRLTGAISDLTGIDPTAVLLVCSRTRGAPYTTPLVGWPGTDEEYISNLVAQVPPVVAEAMARMENAAVGLGRASLPHLCYNHRLMTRNMKAISAWLDVPENEVLAPEGPIDPEFEVLVVRGEGGCPLGLLWNFAADNRFRHGDLISAGLPGLVQQEVDERLGDHVPCFYLPGCGGDVSFTYGLERTTDSVASGVVAVMLETPCDPVLELTFSCERVVLPVRDYSKFWSRADVELKAPAAVAAFAEEVKLMAQEAAYAVPARVQAFRIGRYALVGLPGLPFAEFALAVKDGSSAKATLVTGCTGGDVGTVITRAAFEHGGFEAWPARSAKVGPGGGEFLAEEAAALLKGLWSS
jgi:hypothetical protein